MEWRRRIGARSAAACGGDGVHCKQGAEFLQYSYTAGNNCRQPTLFCKSIALRMLCVMPFPAPIDPIAAARWLRRTPTAAPWLHEEVARRMAARLPAIRLPVQRWAHWLPALGGGGRDVAAHYPHAECVSAPPASNVQLVWANMLAHAAPDAPALLAAWHEALADGGFLMFSCLGPDTLLELRALYERHHRLAGEKAGDKSGDKAESQRQRADR